MHPTATRHKQAAICNRRQRARSHVSGSQALPHAHAAHAVEFGVGPPLPLPRVKIQASEQAGVL